MINWITIIEQFHSHVLITISYLYAYVILQLFTKYSYILVLFHTDNTEYVLDCNLLLLYVGDHKFHYLIAGIFALCISRYIK